MKKFFQRRATVVTSIYFLAAGAWIAGSDLLVAGFVQEESARVSLGIVKGLVFVLVTGLLLFWERVNSDRRYQQSVDDLRASEERYRTVVEQAADGIALCDQEGNLFEMNQAGATMIGYAPEDLIGSNVSTLIVPEDLIKLPLQIQRLQSQESLRLIRKLRHHRGKEVMVEINSQLLRDGSVLTIFRDVSEHIQRTEELAQRVEERTTELRAANLQLRELDRLKSRFIRDVSHELRHPLANLVLYTHLLNKTPRDKYAYYIEVINSQVEVLRTLVEGILDFSREDHQPLISTQIDFNNLIEQILSTHISSPQLSFRFYPTSTLPPLWAIRPHISQILSHLLQNAQRYTVAGTVTVTTLYQAKEQRVGVTIVDSGIGIPTDDLPHIFDEFYRGSNVDQVQAVGAGLGLSQVRKLLIQAQGTIEVTSTEGEGTAVTLWLPLRMEEIAPTEA